jgi:hypothetical protein
VGGLAPRTSPRLTRVFSRLEAKTRMGNCDNHGHQPFVTETLLANRIASSNATSHLRKTLGTSDGGFRMARVDSSYFD